VPPLIIQITPNPIVFSLGPLAIGWYGLAYVAALGVLIYVSQRMAARYGYDPAHIGNAFVELAPSSAGGCTT